jgi:hypothetical protein
MECQGGGGGLMQGRHWYGVLCWTCWQLGTWLAQQVIYARCFVLLGFFLLDGMMPCMHSMHLDCSAMLVALGMGVPLFVVGTCFDMPTRPQICMFPGVCVALS